MNKELKFRVWDILDKKFYDENSHFQEHYVISLNGKFHNLHNGVGGDEVVIQQYTGIKDKNNKEIYEGDIVKNYNNYIFKIEWSESRENEPCWNIARPPYYVEIIGNIFENQNLINL